jgi:hypothetical protein
MRKNFAARLYEHLRPEPIRELKPRQAQPDHSERPKKKRKVEKVDVDNGNAMTTESLGRLSEGYVFFNHFIATNEKLTPSLLLQAWNRGAAIMSKPNTVGIDFIVPIVLPPEEKHTCNLGPLFGTWDPEAEQAGERLLSYICIDAKNWEEMTKSLLRNALDKCKPSSDNFNHHTPRNPFISLVASFGTPSPRDKYVEIWPVRNTELSSGTPLQVRIAARGFQYPFLEGKPGLVELLKQLLENEVDPKMGLEDNPATRVMMDSMPFHNRAEQRSFRVRVEDLEEEDGADSEEDDDDDGDEYDDEDEE